MRRSPFLVPALVLLALRPVLAEGATIEGLVYVDANQNARREAGEAGAAGVLVSDGRTVAATDASGRYRLETAEPRALLRITVPRDHAALGPFWRWTDGGQAEDFALVKKPQAADFCFVQITDTHVGRADLLGELLQRVDRFPVPIMFVINTGDLVGGVDGVLPDKAREQYDRYLGAAAACRLPLWNLPGNHEHVAINVKEADQSHPLYGKGLYRQLLGPTYYSWDWGDVHFIALDGTSLPYQENLGAEQLAWLKADLARQPADKPLALFCHQSAPQLRAAPIPTAPRKASGWSRSKEASCGRPIPTAKGATRSTCRPRRYAQGHHLELRRPAGAACEGQPGHVACGPSARRRQGRLQRRPDLVGVQEGPDP